MGYSYLTEEKTLWVNEKLLITSNFFSHNVFKSCLLLMHQTEYLWSKGLTRIFSVFNVFYLSKTPLEFFTTQSRLLTPPEKEATTIFSFSHNVFYSFQNKFQFLCHINFAIYKYLQFGLAYNFAGR